LTGTPAGNAIRISGNKKGADKGSISISLAVSEDSAPLAGGLVDPAAKNRIAAFSEEVGITFLPPEFEKVQPCSYVDSGYGAIAPE
jgi:hypothetical protein